MPFKYPLISSRCPRVQKNCHPSYLHLLSLVSAYLHFFPLKPSHHRARGEARAASDVDLLITAPDAWLAGQDRFALLAELWGAVAQPDLSVDLVLHSSGEAARRLREPGSLVHEAIIQGVLLSDYS